MPQSINQHMSRADLVTLTILAFLWGGSYFFIEILVDHMPPLTIVAARLAIASLALWALVGVQKIPVPKKPQHWFALLILGFLNNALPFSLIVWGQTEIDSGLASILNATTPIFTILIAGLFLVDEKPNRNKLTGVLIGIIGTVVLIGPEAIGGVTGSALGQLAVVSASLSYAVAGIYSRRFKEWGISPLLVATGQVTSAALIMLPVAAVFEQPWAVSFPSPIAIGSLVWLALMSTVLAYVLYFRLIASAGASNASLVALLVPVTAIVLGAVILGETFTLLQTLGMALIGIGLIVMDGRLLERMKPAASEGRGFYKDVCGETASSDKCA